MQRKVLILLAVILGVTIIGCNQAAPKPLQNQPGTSTPKVTTPQPNMERVLADRFAKLANEVSGVKASTVVVTKNADGNNYTVMVGVELNADMKGTASENVKKQVSDKIKKADKTVSKVLVTTDPDLITRLKDIANGVIQGKPVSSFANEIEELGKRIAPSMK